MNVISSSMAALCWLAITSSAAEAPATFTVSEFTFKRPANWEWVETTSSMRKAQLKVSDSAKTGSGEVVFFYFGEGNGGGTQPNIDRWFGQFQESRNEIKAKSEVVTVGQHKVTYVEAEGTFLSGTPGGAKTPMPNYMLVGAIIEGKQGNVFIKFTGPASLVKTSRDDFRKMVESGLN